MLERGTPSFEQPPEDIQRPAHQEVGDEVVEGEAKFRPIVNLLASITKKQNHAVRERMARVIAEKAPHGELRAEDLATIEQETASREELRDLVFSQLEKDGLLSYGPKKEVIVDLEQLKNFRSKGGWKRFTHIAERKKRFATYIEGGGGSVNLLLYAFENIPVISRNNWDNGIREGRSLFYSPETFDDATNLEKIRQSNFYVSMHEVIKNVRHDLRYPSGADHFTLSEATVPLLLYHPRYGNGYRDEDGHLMIQREDGSYKPVASKFFTKEHIYAAGDPAKGMSLHTPVSFFQGPGARLVQRGVVRLEDFAAMTVGSTAERFGIKTGITGNGFVTVEGVRYFLGRQFDKERREQMHGEPQVYKLSQTLGGVTEQGKDGKERLSHIFDLTTQDDQRLTRRRAHTPGRNIDTFDASGTVTHCRPYHAEEFHRRHPEETEEEYQNRIRTVDDFESLLQLSQFLLKETGININQLSLQEQQWAARAVKTVDGGEEEVKALAERYGLAGLRLLFSMEYGDAAGERVSVLRQRLPEKQMRDLCEAFGGLVQTAQQEAPKIMEEMHARYPHFVLREEEIAETLLHRAHDMIVEMARYAERGDKAGSALLLEEVEKESAIQNVFRSQFTRVAELLLGTDVDLAKQKQREEQTRLAATDRETNAVFLRALQHFDRLAPVPEIHWRVDRSLEEYERRFGFDVLQFLRDTKPERGRKTLLEFGPGSGMSKRERAFSDVGNSYADFAVADKVYYPISSVIEKIIDFETLEEQTGKLNPEEQAMLSDFLYRTLVITPKEAGSDRFTYNTDVQRELADDINALKGIIQDSAALIGATDTVPQTISTRDPEGNVIYPYKIKASEQSAAWKKAKALLAENPRAYLVRDLEERDLYADIDAFPPGVMISDFSRVDRMKPKQVDVALGVRSTVYLRGEEYVRFLDQFSRVLKDGGVYIDDSIRDNDGYRYRLAEFLDFEQQITKAKAQGGLDDDIAIRVIVGPAFSGEDYNQHDAVPLAFVMAKNTSIDDLISDRLGEGYRLVTLDELVEDEEYLRRLDATGAVAAEVAERRDALAAV